VTGLDVWVRPQAVLEAALAVDGVSCAAQLDLFEREGWLSEDAAGWFVARAWDLCGHPMQVLPRERWVALFRLAGYTHEFVPAPRPVEAVRLFRGSDEAGAEGMSWSSRLDVARWFAVQRAGGRVWSAVVEPWRLLAFMAGVSEDQTVVDTAGLVAEVVEGPEVVSAFDEVVVAERLDWWQSVRAGGGGGS
jgi:hypothetical protein